MINHYSQRTRHIIATTSLLLMACPIHAAPYIPNSDTEVLLQLPSNHHVVAKKLRQRQIQLTDKPLDIKRATSLAKTYIELGGSTADPVIMATHKQYCNPGGISNIHP